MPGISFAVGTTVRRKGHSLDEIVLEATSTDGELEYGLSESGWWHSHKDLRLISEPTEETLNAALHFANPDDNEEL